MDSTTILMLCLLGFLLLVLGARIRSRSLRRRGRDPLRDAPPR